MQFVADGPHIPVEVLRAQEEGSLVLFCGAGISIRAGLPSFQGLVHKVYEGLGATPSPGEEKELEGPQPSYDRVLDLLEGPGRFTPAQVRRQVVRILATPPDPNLDTHRAILRLSRDRSGVLRLVTTNFDLLFEAAEPGIRATTAPLLPVPKPRKWSQLVHLHGRLDEADPDGVHLVLTSADFGTAYLVERWASRFVTELFRHFTVLFLGYAVDDPPMRYLIDAIAAERRQGDRLHPSFALAAHAPGRRADEDFSWRAKGITPILYEDLGDHVPLHGTLAGWGRIWSGGLRSKLSIVRDLAPQDRGPLPAEALSQFSWVVSDDSGAMAEELGRLRPPAKLAWLDVLERDGVLSGPPLAGSAAEMALVDDGRTTERVPSLDPVRRGLAAWLAKHAADPELARWAVRRGGRLHPELQELIRGQLEDVSALSPSLRKVWLALTGSVRLQQRQGAYDRFGSHGRVRRDEWGPALRTELLAALAPCIELRTSWTSLESALQGEEQRATRDTVRSIVSFDCELEAGQSLEPILNDLAARPDCSAMLADLAFDLTHLLHEALDFHAALDGASEQGDPSYIQHPSIAPHEQNRHLHGWTRLIDLVWQAYEALRERHRERADTLVGVWSSIAYPLFRRLVLHAWWTGGFPSAPALLGLLTREPRSWVWSATTQVELFAALPGLWSNLGDADRANLISTILEGPPREMFREDLAPGDWHEIRDHSIWQRLARIVRGGAVLGGDAASHLARIEEEHPEWRLTGAEKEDFPTWMEAGWGLPTDYSAESLLALTDEELRRVLQQHDSNREGLLDSWRQAAESDGPRAVGLLLRFLEEGYLDQGVWSHALSALRETGEDPGLKQKLLGLLERLPPALTRHAEIVRPAADSIRSISRLLPDALRPRLLALWDAVLSQALSVEAGRSDERISDAINHPAGVLAEALLDVLRSRSLERGSGIEEDVRCRLERIVRSQGPAAALGRVIVASWLPLLHDLDPDWTQVTVVPLFDWQDPDEAQGAWQGFLRSRWLRPSLWASLRPHFLVAFDHVDALGRSEERLAGILASIAIEGEGALSPLETGQCLRKLGEEGRASAAVWVLQKLEEAGPQAPSLWRDSIGPWLAAAWPGEPVLRDPSTSGHLARAAVLTGEAFPEAAHLVSELVEPIEHAGIILHTIGEQGLMTISGEACLELVNALTPDEPPRWFGPLGAFLGKLQEAQPGLADDPRFRRLHDIAIRSGL